MEGDMTIEISNVTKWFALPDGSEAQALADTSFSVADGEFVVIVGPSGCGKTTILNMMAGLIMPTAGAITIDGRPIDGPGIDRGVMFQDYALFPWRSVEGNVGFALEHGPAGAAMDEAARARRITDTIALVGLKGSEHKYPHQLSGGMRQRVAFARLLAYGPKVLLMDEPLAALDAQTRTILQEELLRVWGQALPAAERRTVVFITHAIDEAVFLADRIIVMGNGPGHVRDIVAVDLPRPRGDATRVDPRFQELVQKIWSQIKNEAYRAATA
jgi:NitT/TauT family transport system ATP-binding protein